ncbi:hypothetical protein BE08_15055 [Sorangium cellulosum]|uniref:Uncharacterized protein n=1 Tax=Sorangium cellulosum TaxID=56 RepID=A0A150P2M2_SORCE|nr:hypothetical protein BE08_15055 [Sorangium cellulosum]
MDVSRILSDTMDDGAELYARHFTNHDAYHAFEPLLGGTLDRPERFALITPLLHHPPERIT